MPVWVPADIPDGMPKDMPDRRIHREHVSKPKSDHITQHTLDVRSTCQKICQNSCKTLTAGQCQSTWPQGRQNTFLNKYPSLCVCVCQDSKSIHLPCLPPNRPQGGTAWSKVILSWATYKLFTGCFTTQHVKANVLAQLDRLQVIVFISKLPDSDIN